MCKTAARCCAMALAAVGLNGQSAGPRLAFDVASIRAHDGPLDRIFDFSASGARLTLTGYPLVGLIEEAYDLKGYELTYAHAVPAPDSVFYDIVAKAPGAATPTRSEFRQMLQTLLADRFALKCHRQSKALPIYALVVGKHRPKLKESAASADGAVLNGVNGRNQAAKGTKITMEALAQIIESRFGVGRRVVDKTGLTGAYDIAIEATPEPSINRSAETGDISIFTAVQELGLKLEPDAVMSEVLVVDHWEKPSAN